MYFHAYVHSSTFTFMHKLFHALVRLFAGTFLQSYVHAQVYSCEGMRGMPSKTCQAYAERRSKHTKYARNAIKTILSMRRINALFILSVRRMDSWQLFLSPPILCMFWTAFCAYLVCFGQYSVHTQYVLYGVPHILNTF